MHRHTAMLFAQGADPATLVEAALLKTGIPIPLEPPTVHGRHVAIVTAQDHEDDSVLEWFPVPEHI